MFTASPFSKAGRTRLGVTTSGPSQLLLPAEATLLAQKFGQADDQVNAAESALFAVGPVSDKAKSLGLVEVISEYQTLLDSSEVKALKMAIVMSMQSGVPGSIFTSWIEKANKVFQLGQEAYDIAVIANTATYEGGTATKPPAWEEPTAPRREGESGTTTGGGTDGEGGITGKGATETEKSLLLLGGAVAVAVLIFMVS